MTFLYDEIIAEFGRQGLAAVETPQVVASNLKHRIRPYQAETFARFVLWQKEFARTHQPHLMFNMATGSGKTLIMAGLMLMLYAQGYRNFLFFVNSSNIIQKTKDNFLAATTTKYLFADAISVDGSEVLIKEVSSFTDSQENRINIKFTTIQQLHTDLGTYKENGITLEDLGEHKMILLADEAHHLNVEAHAQGSFLENWEKTVAKIMQANAKNMLLEFTATVDYSNVNIVEKYANKIIYRYDLKQFRQDRYSKEINLFRSDYDETERIIQALILNIYRQEIAVEHNINLKPVILFKAKKTIAESQENKERFHLLIDNFSAQDVKKIRNSTAKIIVKAFAFFKHNGMTDTILAQRIRSNFTRENCISANNEEEKEINQIRLNTLEDSDNPLRAVFAVQKLNEGWDVLNLFDIVRLYETRDARNNKPGKTTIAEAQLIGRGARYFPFTVSDKQDAYKRKYDKDHGNDLKILEELYYHTREQSEYISELKRALESTGIYEDDSKTDLVDLALKANFKKTDLYKSGKVFYNQKNYSEKHKINRNAGTDLSGLSVDVRTYRHRLASGVGRVSSGLDILESEDQTSRITTKVVPAAGIPFNVKRYALSANPFYWFDNLRKWFGVCTVIDFINDQKYLGGLGIKFEGAQERLLHITHHDYFVALQGQLAAVENEIKQTTAEFIVSKWIDGYVHKIFTDKQVRVKKDYAGGQPIAEDAAWYAYNNNYGTPEENGFVEMFANYFNAINKRHKNIYLLRNERQLKIYNTNGQRFEPDFLLFCEPNSGKNLTYQIFIEPKGDIFLTSDKWKEDFLLEILNKSAVIDIDAGQYKILGLPFYNRDPKKQTLKRFEKCFRKTLNIQDINSEIVSD